MKISDGMTITIVDMMGKKLTEGFYLPEEAFNEDGITVSDEQAQHFGHQMVKEFMKCKKELEDFEQRLLDNCNCFWKDLPEDERLINRCHSSECASWEME